MVRIRVRLSIDARAARAALTALLLCAAAPELESQVTETVAVTTYYPAPKGYYTQLTTTGQTYLAALSGNARIGTTSTAGSARLGVMGRVGVGTSNPDAMLHVAGSQNFGTDPTVDRTWGVDWHVASIYGPGYAYGISREGGPWAGVPKMLINWQVGVKLKAHGNYNAVSIWEVCGTGLDQDCATPGTAAGFGSEIARFRISAYEVQGNGVSATWGGSYINSRLTVGSNANAAASLYVTGDGVGVFRQPAAQCSQVAYGTGGTTTCSAGYYATNQIGILSRYGSSPSSGAGTMYCCRCPLNNAGAASCPTLPDS